MNKFIIIFFKYSLFLLLLFNKSCPTINNKKSLNQYQLVWSDEFNIDGIPNSNNWNYEYGFVRNKEAQWYQKENAFCKDGYLIIEAKKETKANPHFINTTHRDWKKNRDSIKISSSCLITQNKHSWKYGKFEMRAKIPTDKGIWPAFWTLGISQRWPANGEIDIMEYYKGDVLANMAWESERKGKPEWDSKKVALKTFNNKSWTDEFHIWRMDWDEDFIKLYIDNQLINEVNLKDTFNKTNGENPFHQPHYLLINLAVGGMNGGNVSFDVLPTQFIIDYIRVYQKK